MGENGDGDRFHFLAPYGVTTISFATSITPETDTAARCAATLSASDRTVPDRRTAPSTTVARIERASVSASVLIASSALDLPYVGHGIRSHPDGAFHGSDAVYLAEDALRLAPLLVEDDVAVQRHVARA
jgi:ribulose 1,5-bisphosphate carboxylase large subunit-like protein